MPILGISNIEEENGWLVPDFAQTHSDQRESIAFQTFLGPNILPPGSFSWHLADFHLKYELYQIVLVTDKAHALVSI